MSAWLLVYFLHVSCLGFCLIPCLFIQLAFLLKCLIDFFAYLHFAKLLACLPDCLLLYLLICLHECLIAGLLFACFLLRFLLDSLLIYLVCCFAHMLNYFLAYLPVC